MSGGRVWGKRRAWTLLGYFELLRAAALCFDAFGCLAALTLDLAGDLVGAEEFEGVAVDVVEAGDDASEEGLLGRVMKADAASGPLLVGGVDVFGEEAYLGVASDEFVVFSAGPGGDES